MSKTDPEPPLYTYRATPTTIIDGDTFDADVDLGFTVWVRIRFRLLGVDTPERGHTDAPAATQMLADLLTQAADTNGTVLITSTKTGKYGRWLAEIDGVNSELSRRWPYQR